MPADSTLRLEVKLSVSQPSCYVSLSKDKKKKYKQTSLDDFEGAWLRNPGGAQNYFIADITLLNGDSALPARTNTPVELQARLLVVGREGSELMCVDEYPGPGAKGNLVPVGENKVMRIEGHGSGRVCYKINNLLSKAYDSNRFSVEFSPLDRSLNIKPGRTLPILIMTKVNAKRKGVAVTMHNRVVALEADLKDLCHDDKAEDLDDIIELHTRLRALNDKLSEYLSRSGASDPDMISINRSEPEQKQSIVMMEKAMIGGSIPLGLQLGSDSVSLLGSNSVASSTGTNLTEAIGLLGNAGNLSSIPDIGLRPSSDGTANKEARLIHKSDGPKPDTISQSITSRKRPTPRTKLASSRTPGIVIQNDPNEANRIVESKIQEISERDSFDPLQLFSSIQVKEKQASMLLNTATQSSRNGGFLQPLKKRKRNSVENINCGADERSIFDHDTDARASSESASESMLGSDFDAFVENRHMDFSVVTKNQLLWFYAIDTKVPILNFLVDETLRKLNRTEIKQHDFVNYIESHKAFVVRNFVRISNATDRITKTHLQCLTRLLPRYLKGEIAKQYDFSKWTDSAHDFVLGFLAGTWPNRTPEPPSIQFSNLYSFMILLCHRDDAIEKLVDLLCRHYGSIMRSIRTSPGANLANTTSKAEIYDMHISPKQQERHFPVSLGVCNEFASKMPSPAAMTAETEKRTSSDDDDEEAVTASSNRREASSSTKSSTDGKPSMKRKSTSAIV